MAYVPHNAADRDAMLETIGLESIDDLFRSLPAELQLGRLLDVPAGAGEAGVLRDLERLAERNTRLDRGPSFLGAGCYRRFVPAAIDALASRGEYSTAYTPYQAEVSQGTLQAIIEYQTMICQLTGMEISNASMYDAATALAESVLMAWAIHGRGRRVCVSEGVHPEYRRVLETYVRHHPIEVETIALEGGTTPVDAIGSALDPDGEGEDDVVAVVVQSPNFLGFLEATQSIGALFDAAADRKRRPLLIAVVDPVSLGVLEPPGAWSADIAIGDGQGLGNPPSYGGPSFGFFTTRHKHVRKVPGRIVGETVDRSGRRGYVLTFQTREQHIRRERATSNICTNQGLCSLRGAMYLALLGREGLQEVAAASTRKAHHAFARLTALPGVEPVAGAPFFQEFPLRLPRPAADVYRELSASGIVGGLPLGRYFAERENEMMFATTEMTTVDDIDRLVNALAGILSAATENEARAEAVQ